MDLTKFGEELRKLRLEKQVSLMDISFSTRINVKFLEAIEAGKFSVLPQTYVRAFLREYGEAIGMGVGEILQKYDTLREPRSIQTNQTTKPTPQPAPPARPIATPSRKFPAMLRKNMFFAVLLVVAVAFVFYLRNTNPKTPETPPEIPFDAVVKETEATTYKPDTTVRTVYVPPAVKVDSLRLEIATIDSVWISILVDGKITLEYLFPPNRKRIWTAKDQFAITMGNAGGATFRLNGKDLGTLGRRGAVVRKYLIDEARLKSL